MHTSQRQKPLLRNTLYCFSISLMDRSVKFIYDKVSFFIHSSETITEHISVELLYSGILSSLVLIFSGSVWIDKP